MAHYYDPVGRNEILSSIKFTEERVRQCENKILELKRTMKLVDSERVKELIHWELVRLEFHKKELNDQLKSQKECLKRFDNKEIITSLDLY